jgi:hypothetical protein
MSQHEPTTFVELAKHIEQVFRHHRVFYCRGTKGQPTRDVNLVSLVLKEIQFKDQGTSGVYVQFDAVFDSAGAAVQAHLDFIVFAHLRVYNLALGPGKVQAATGHTLRTITCEVSRDTLCGPMRADVDIFRKKNAVAKLGAAAVKAEKASDAYKADAAELKRAGKEIRSLLKTQARLQGKLLARENTARAKGTPSFEVVID